MWSKARLRFLATDCMHAVKNFSGLNNPLIHTDWGNGVTGFGAMSSVHLDSWSILNSKSANHDASPFSDAYAYLTHPALTFPKIKQFCKFSIESVMFNSPRSPLRRSSSEFLITSISTFICSHSWMATMSKGVKSFNSLRDLAELMSIVFNAGFCS